MKGSGEFNSASDLDPRPETFERPEASPPSMPTEDYLSGYSEELPPETSPYSIDADFKLRNPLKAYGDFVGQYPLLTDVQEFAYGIEAQRGRLAVEKLGSDKGTLDQAITSLLRHEATQGSKARELLHLHNLRLPFSLARSYTYKDENTLECIQIGSEELLRAIDEYDPYVGVRVANFAYRRVVGAITKHIVRESFSVRPPDKVFKRIRALQALHDPASNTTREDFAKVLDVKLKNVDEVIRTVEQFVVGFGGKVSLDAVLKGTKSHTITLEDELSQSAFPEPGENGLWRLAEEVLQPKERFVLLLRIEYGMPDKDIGALLHQSRHTTFDMYTRAIKKLRRAAA